MPISATLGVSLVGRRDERRGSWEEHHENPADWAFLLSWASYKAPARLDTNRSRSLCFIHMANSIFIHIGYMYTSERRGHPITSTPLQLWITALFYLVSTQFRSKSITKNIQESGKTLSFDIRFQLSCSVKGTLWSFWPLVVLQRDVFDEPLLFVLCFTTMCTTQAWGGRHKTHLCRKLL